VTEATTPKRRRPRGEGSIYKRAEGGWRGAIIVTDPDTGVRVRRVVSGRTQADVRDRLRDLRRQLEQGIGVKPGHPRTLAAYVAAWLPALRQRVRPATWRAHEQYLRCHVLPALGEATLAKLTPTAVERMTAAMIARRLSPTTARGARTTLRLVLRDAERDGLVSRNVAALARPPRMERHELAVLSADETRRLLDGTEADWLGPLYAVAATTGLRQGELLGLTWADVDGLDSLAPSLTVRHSLALAAAGGWELAEPKTPRSRRTLELGATAARALRRQRTRQKEARLVAGDLWQDRAGMVFTDTLGRTLSGSNVTHSFQDALARLGLPHVRFHDLRHGAASLMLAQGVPLKLVSESLGHSSIAITADVYSHLDREQRRESSDAIERALGSGDRA
jgi:integrase